MSQPEYLAALLEELLGRGQHDPHDATVRRAVRLRARDGCEYCLLPTAGQVHVDHIIPPALWDRYTSGRLRPVVPAPDRRGPDHLGNFAWCCAFCNTAKGQQVAHRIASRTYRLFDPRYDSWSEHFVFAHNCLFIVGITGIGRATEQALGLNTPGLDGPLGTRHDAILVGRYPPYWARQWLVWPGA
ncbi:MAG: HNH endonuclease [Chloroflexi bacterium]|nr:HNH endonuclease [Chloroflexota bacterium]